MKSDPVQQLSIKLSQLAISRRNPRKVKPSRESQQRLVALIRSLGLLQPLTVRPVEGRRYEVIFGEQRLRALKEIHKHDGDPKVMCVVREVDDATADAMALAENFGREAMHPIDEADAFAKLAVGEGKDARAIAAEFGVQEHYVRQRMRLSTLAGVIKAAHRAGKIDTATAEAFSAVPEGRQLEVWAELNGNPRHAEHVRNVIAHAWIDAKDALFDVSTLPPNAVSQDLFGDRVIVERRAFMEAQAQALDAKRQQFVEEGWKEVVVGQRQDVQDRLISMSAPEREFDKETGRKLEKLSQRRAKLEAAASEVDDSDEAKLARIQQRFDDLETREQEILSKAPQFVSEETKALATAFLVLDPDGRVHAEYRVPRRQRKQSGHGNGDGNGSAEGEKPTAPTPDDLSDRQLAVTFTHQALAVRQALLANAAARKRVLALMLHDKVRSEALSLRHEANGTTLAASADGFNSSVFNQLSEKRWKLDPFAKKQYVDDVEGYEQLASLSPAKLDALVDLLIVDHITAHMQRPTPLVQQLAQELKINVRDHWRPDAAWLSGFQKIQLAKLVVDLKGDLHTPPPEAKKSALVDALATLFADAADGKLADKAMAAKINAWLPANLRPVKQSSTR